MVGDTSKKDGFHPRRKYPRFESTNLLSFLYRLPDQKSDIQGIGKTCSLSEGGLMFETDHSIMAGTEIDLQFTLKEHLLNAVGEAIYSLDKGNGVIGIGVRFKVIAEEYRVIIRKYAEHVYPAFDTQFRPDQAY
ncbi:PilZ domain-containing protein [bacterium]|nr:PilZ domain-containing protein [bacterium]